MIRDLTITVDEQGCFCVHGNLSLRNAPKAEALGYELINKDSRQEMTFDLSDITSSNIVLALMTAWIRYAKRKSKKIFFINCSQNLLDLAKVSGLEKLLPFRTKQVR